MSTQSEPQEFITLSGVRTHNLKGIAASFPLGAITAVTGVSGSGKSSLVFDTLYGEAYRRYVESLSSFARQYLKSLPRPALDEAENLPPAIAVMQTRSGAAPRSTVGTLTELGDILRVLFAELGEIKCWNCGERVGPATAEKIAKEVLNGKDSEKVLITSPLSGFGKISAKDLKAQLEGQGFSRLLVGASVVKLAEAKTDDLHRGYVVVDRLTRGEIAGSRGLDSLTLGLRLGRGRLRLSFGESYKDYSKLWECATCNIPYVEPSLPLFSHNHPLGACPTCQGFGFESVIDYDKVIPKKDGSLATRGIQAWNFGKHTVFYSKALKAAESQGIDPKKLFKDYSPNEWEWLKEGSGRFAGIEGYFSYLDRKKYKVHYRIHAARFRKYVVCRDCRGARLTKSALSVHVAGKTMADLAETSLEDLSTWLEKVSAKAGTGEFPTPSSAGALEAIHEGRARLRYLNKVGLHYLTLGRSSRSLSSGELQRINMSRSLGSALTETLFCLDEPSAGLHARDSANLLEVIRELKEQGNTVVLVEHERSLIEGADNRIVIGPKAGHLGGEIVSRDVPDQRRVIEPRSTTPKGPFLELSGARTNNLQNVTARFPTSAITAVCGVSGSGKTSLVRHTLYPLLAHAFGDDAARSVGGESQPIAESIGPERVVAGFGGVAIVSQATLGRSSRSTIGTYLGMMEEIRKLLAAEPLASKLGLKPGSFSFNTKGGRCETCKGLGTEVLDLSFLGEMEVICGSCNGRRFGDDVLSVRYRGLSLIDILGLTITQTRELFFDQPGIVRIADAVIALGLGYLTLGQSTNSFSGGEAQRLRLLGLLTEEFKDKPKVLIFDEPTTGLSDDDVAVLLNQFRELSAKGHTIIIIEHHLDVLKSADWLIEVGPEAGNKGGQIVYQGPPAGLTVEYRQSATAPFLKRA